MWYRRIVATFLSKGKSKNEAIHYTLDLSMRYGYAAINWSGW